MDLNQNSEKKCINVKYNKLCLLSLDVIDSCSGADHSSVRCRIFWMRNFVHGPWVRHNSSVLLEPRIAFSSSNPEREVTRKRKRLLFSTYSKAKNQKPFAICFFFFLFILFSPKSMDFGPIFYVLIGFSMSVSLCLPNLKKWQSQQITAEKLRIITEALEHAEERAIRFQERHDRVLSQVGSYYLCNQELLEALAVSRIAMNEALGFAVGLRKMQMEIICSYPDEVDDVILRRLSENTGSASATRRNRWEAFAYSDVCFPGMQTVFINRNKKENFIISGISKKQNKYINFISFVKVMITIIVHSHLH